MKALINGLYYLPLGLARLRGMIATSPSWRRFFWKSANGGKR